MKIKKVTTLAVALALVTVAGATAVFAASGNLEGSVIEAPQGSAISLVPKGTDLERRTSSAMSEDERQNYIAAIENGELLPIDEIEDLDAYLESMIPDSMKEKRAGKEYIEQSRSLTNTDHGEDSKEAPTLDCQ